MRKAQIGKICLGFSLILGMLMMLSTGLVAQDPEPPRVRPTVDPIGETGGGGTGENGEDSVRAASSGSGGAVNSDNCAALQGSVINWGVGSQPGVNMIFSDGGWGIQDVTKDDGGFGFGGLGVGIGVLRVEPGLTGLKPMVNDAAIRLRCDFVTQAHIGLYGGDERPTPPGQITMRASAKTVSPGDMVRFDLTVTNSLPNPMSQVMVTDLMPDGLTIQSVNTSTGTVEVLGNNKMLAVMIGSVPENGKVAISFSASVGANIAVGTKLSNAATLLYAESAADQAALTIDVGSTDTSVASTVSNALASASVEGADETAQAIIPDVLPTTGFGGTLYFPLVILTVIGLVVKGFHSIQRRQTGFRDDDE